VTVHYTLYDGADAVAEHTTSSQPVGPAGAGATIVTGGPLQVAAPKLWSVRRPYLYRLTTQLLGGAAGNQVMDEINTTLGLRSIDWSKDGAWPSDPDPDPHSHPRTSDTDPLLASTSPPSLAGLLTPMTEFLFNLVNLIFL